MESMNVWTHNAAYVPDAENDKGQGHKKEAPNSQMGY